ncbi:hypothetical protein FA13DRAFT_555699 [Coprinellus micaceus]|uniref:Uncharacterized protein n=1 Tax=Coprinellus micaceus TaxID=71717 RepID=A0A4Y7T8K4_COPMI|nr:hypothetical protein FA13DRAFT_555699 [Coprinellus micaceus]
MIIAAALLAVFLLRRRADRPGASVVTAANTGHHPVPPHSPVMSEGSPYILDGSSTLEPKPHYPATQSFSNRPYTAQVLPSSNSQAHFTPSFPSKPNVGQTYYTSLLPEPVQ